MLSEVDSKMVDTQRFCESYLDGFSAAEWVDQANRLNRTLAITPRSQHGRVIENVLIPRTEKNACLAEKQSHQGGVHHGHKPI